jgi:cysteinyl-tRNA synthetase
MLKVHDTLRGKLEVFEPIKPGAVGMYVCGVTVYDRSHIGHARALVCFDVIYRYLKFSGYEVTFVRNLTDVDDKIIKRAQDRGVPAQQVSEENIAAFNEDMRVLRCERPDIEPKATEHIAEMIALIGELEEKGLAYESSGDVYFSVDKLPQYGKLSHRKLDDMMAGARIEVDDRKRHPMDFAMWKASKPGEPAWDSPWGKGRPGWHIECSAMSSKYLGQPFDIHGGGNDLVFPHHENEIAQSEGAKGCALARYWLHNGMVNLGTEKMSKSAGNMMTIQDCAAEYGGESLRYLVIGTHYRGPLDFSVERLQEQKKVLDRIYESLARADEALANNAGATDETIRDQFVAAFREGMDEDFNTSRGLAALHDALRAMNRHIDAGEWPQAAGCRAALRQITGVLGVGAQDPAEHLQSQKHRTLSSSEVSAEEIEALIQERLEARKAKNFARADEIRDQLKARGIILEDSPSGTTWKTA